MDIYAQYWSSKCLTQVSTMLTIIYNRVRIIVIKSWFEVRGSFSFCWYWWNCWSSLFKLSCHKYKLCVMFVS